MSRENVQLLYEVINTFNRRDLEAFLALMDPGIEFTPYERAIEGLGPYRGHDGVRSWWNDAFGALPDLHAELHDVRDLGGATLARGRLSGSGAGSGASFERTLWLVARWRNGKEVWWHAFEGEAEALEAVGLSE